GDRPRTELATAPDLARLCREYAAKLLAAGYREAAAQPYGFARTAAGLPLDRRMRRLYRAALLAADARKSSDPPDPFDLSKIDVVRDWLNSAHALNSLEPIQLAAIQIESVALPRSPLLPVRVVQKVLLRLLRPLTDHQRRIDVALLAAIRAAQHEDGD